MALAKGYRSILGYFYKRLDLGEVKLRELNYTVTTHPAILYILVTVRVFSFVD